MEPTASFNLRHIAGKIQVLDLFYNQVRQNCTGLEIGYGSTTGWDLDPEAQPPFPIFQENGRVYIKYPAIQVQIPVPFERTMNVIDILLKYLSGDEFPEDELEDMLEDSYLEILGTLISDIDRFDSFIDPVIQWLSATVSQCPQIQINQNINSEAASNLLHIANRIRLLESFYEQTQDMCSGLESVFEGYKSIPYKDTITLIGISLKYLSGRKLDYGERFILSAANQYNILNLFSPDYEQGKLDLEKVESILDWLFNTLNQCRITQTGISIAQQLQLENLYSPSGQIAQQAAQRFYGRI